MPRARGGLCRVPSILVLGRQGPGVWGGAGAHGKVPGRAHCHGSVASLTAPTQQGCPPPRPPRPALQRALASPSLPPSVHLPRPHLRPLSWSQTGWRTLGNPVRAERAERGLPTVPGSAQALGGGGSAGDGRARPGRRSRAGQATAGMWGGAGGGHGGRWTLGKKGRPTWAGGSPQSPAPPCRRLAAAGTPAQTPAADRLSRRPPAAQLPCLSSCVTDRATAAAPTPPLTPPLPSAPHPLGPPPTGVHVHGSCVDALWPPHFLCCT